MTPQEAIEELKACSEMRTKVFGADDSSVKVTDSIREVIEGLVAEVKAKNKTIANLEKQVMELNDAAIESEGF